MCQCCLRRFKLIQSNFILLAILWIWCFIILILTVRKLRYRGIKWPPQDHTIGKLQMQDSSRGGLNLGRLLCSEHNGWVKPLRWKQRQGEKKRRKGRRKGGKKRRERKREREREGMNRENREKDCLGILTFNGLEEKEAVKLWISLFLLCLSY